MLTSSSCLHTTQVCYPALHALLAYMTSNVIPQRWVALCIKHLPWAAAAEQPLISSEGVSLLTAWPQWLIAVRAYQLHRVNLRAYASSFAAPSNLEIMRDDINHPRLLTSLSTCISGSNGTRPVCVQMHSHDIA